MKFGSISLLLFCLFCTTAFAQNEIVVSGQVKDESNQPIPLVLVAIENTTTGVYTDDSGMYSLKVARGEYTITATCVGYKSIKQLVSLVQNKTLDIQLQKSEIALKTVDVYGKTKSQQVRESVYAVNALDVRPMINSLNNLNALVGRSTGIRIREDGGLGSDFDLVLNGLSGNSIRYFVDGIPLSSMGSGMTLANLPINIIERVEVYKGVVPAELGADALGGAINIITTKSKKNYIDVSYGIGSFHTHKGDFNAQFVDEKSGLLIRPTLGVNFSKNDYKMKGVEIPNETQSGFETVDVKRFHDDFLSVFGKLEVGFVDKKWTDAFFVSGSYSAVDKDIQTGLIQSIVYGKARREKRSFNTLVQYQKKDFLHENLSSQFSVSHTIDNSVVIDTVFRKYWWDGSSGETYRNEITGRDKSIRHIKRPLTIARANLDYKFHHNHSVNLNYLLEHTDNKRSDDVDLNFEASKDALTKHIIGLSYQQNLLDNKLLNTFFLKHYVNHLKIGQQDLSWITGSKDIKSSSTSNHSGYGLGSRYHLIDALSLKASFEHSIRLPVAREFQGNGTTVYPNFKLKPESSDNYNVGIFGTWDIASDHRLRYEASFFGREVKDYIRVVLSETDGLSQYDNVRSVAVRGVEGEITYSYANLLQLVANCSYLDEKSKTKYQADGKPEITYNNQMPNRPWFYSNAELNMKKHNPFGAKGTQLKISYYFQYVHWFYLTWKGYGALKSKATIPAQYNNSVSVSYSIDKEKYNVSLECNNLFDRMLYDNYKLQKPGRAFFLKFRVFIG